MREYTYQASDADSKITARTIAKQELCNQLLSEIGMFIQSESLLETQLDGTEQVFTEKIEAITAGITEMEILEESWNGVQYWIRAKIVIDPEDIAKSIDLVLNDKEKTQELEESRKRISDAETEIQRLTEALKKAEELNHILEIQQQYFAETEKLTVEEIFNKAYYAAGTGNYDEAIRYLTLATEKSPNNIKIYNNLGSTYGLKKDYENAIKCFQKVIELKPEYDAAYFNLGYVYELSGSKEQAIETYKTAAKLGNAAAQKTLMGWRINWE